MILFLKKLRDRCIRQRNADRFLDETASYRPNGDSFPHVFFNLSGGVHPRRNDT